MVNPGEFTSIDRIERRFDTKPKEALASPLGKKRKAEEEDFAMIDMVYTPAEGGIHTWLRGFLYPFYGFPKQETVMTMTTIKKLIPEAFRLCFWLPIKIGIGFLVLIFREKFATRAIDAFINFAYPPIKRALATQHPLKFKKSVREIYRAMNLTANEMPDKLFAWKVRLEKLRDIICMFLEYDNAYTLRLQDIIVELDKRAFERNPPKEIRRLMGVMIEREKNIPMAKKLKGLKNVIYIFLRFSPHYCDILKKVVRELDVEKVKLDKGDWYFCKKRMDYYFGGKKKFNNIALNSPNVTKEEMYQQLLEKIKSRRLVVQQQFDNANKEKNRLSAEIQEKQKRIEELNMVLLRLQGRFAEIAEEETHIQGIIKNEEKYKERAELMKKKEKEKK